MRRICVRRQFGELGASPGEVCVRHRLSAFVGGSHEARARGPIGANFAP